MVPSRDDALTGGQPRGRKNQEVNPRTAQNGLQELKKLEKKKKGGGVEWTQKGWGRDHSAEIFKHHVENPTEWGEEGENGKRT